jgi:hypothetical protein
MQTDVIICAICGYESYVEVWEYNGGCQECRGRKKVRNDDFSNALFAGNARVGSIKKS